MSRRTIKVIRRRKRLTQTSIYRFVNRCRLELKKCEKTQAYLSALILIGAAVEYTLTAWMRAYPEELYRRRKKITQHWDFKDLNRIAHEAGLFDREAFLAAERIRKYRNRVHPN